MDNGEGNGLIKVIVLFGTRPEAIKMAPVVKELARHSDRVATTVCVTGQHRQMLDQILETFDIRPDIDLELMRDNQGLSALTARATRAIDEVLARIQPDLVLVQGDTTTAMVGGLVAHYHRVPVGHVEAGLRTEQRYDPFPEEMNRRLLSVLSTLHFAPTQTSYDGLIREGYPSEDVILTGNTVVDALLWVRDVMRAKRARDVFSPGCRGILVTAHRRENFQGPLLNICRGLRRIVDRFEDVEIVYPVHLNPNIRGPVHDLLSGHERIRLIEPLMYEDLVIAMDQAHMVMTDSGGIQEEAPALGKPVLVMRETTERPEGVSAGVARLIGTGEESIFNEASRLLTDGVEHARMARAVSPYGDGRAAENIVNVILDRFCPR